MTLSLHCWRLKQAARPREAWDGTGSFKCYTSTSLLPLGFTAWLNTYVSEIENIIFAGTAGHSLEWHNGLPYSTKDHNNGDCPDEECAKMYHGAWWYGDSIQSNLNGKYYMTPIAPAHDGIIWAGWRGFNTSLKWTEMKMRPCLDWMSIS